MQRIQTTSAQIISVK